MVNETFEKNRLPWKFIQDVVNQVSELKKNLVDYLPEKFQKLAKMSGEEMTKRRNDILLSLMDILSIQPEKVSLGKSITVQIPETSKEQKEYIWQALHELELIDILATIKGGSIFAPLIQDFNNTKVEIGRYNWPDNEKIHNGLYIRLFRPNPDGGAHSIQMGPIDK